MLACRNCLRSTCNAVLRSTDTKPRLVRVIPVFQQQRKTYATAVLEKPTPAQESVPAAGLTESGAGAKKKSAVSPKKLQWIVNQHLAHLNDPYNIANHVRERLVANAYDETLLLVQTASKDMKVTVSWNHLIDYLLKKQRLHAAVKLFNDMKKRAQLPNAQTYTILFRGFANSEHPKLAAAEAFRIYNTMLRMERIEANTMHMNAVLDVCARARDIDLLFTVVDTADARNRAPDTRTYTIIFNALRHQVEPSLSRRSELDEAQQKMVTVAVERAKSVWQEVLRSWKQNKIVMDELLVCSMGRILLQGDHKDRKSIFALLEQTMNLPMLANPDKNELKAKELESATEPESQASDAATQPKAVVSSPTVLKVSGGGSPQTFATPAHNTLSLIMSAISQTKNSSAAPKYWRLLTESYNVVPDRDNYVKYLKVLQRGNASTKAADLVQSMPKHLCAPKFWRIGLQACIDDNLNKHAFANACRIFDDMIARKDVPDAMAMRLFLHAARANYRQFAEQREKNPVASKTALNKQVVAALDRMWEPYRILCSSASYPLLPAESPEAEWEQTYNQRVEIVAVARRMMAATDSVIVESVLDDSVMKVLKVRNTIIRRYVSRFNEKLQRMGVPNAHKEEGSDSW